MAVAQTADETASTPTPAPYSRAKIYILVAGIILTLVGCALAIWLRLTLKPSKPHCSLEDLYIPALDSRDLQTMNSTAVLFKLRFWNSNTDKSIYYDNLNVTVYYYGNSLGLPIGNISTPGFRQRKSNTKDRSDTIQTFGAPWEDIRKKVSNGNTALFRVELATKVRYDRMWGMTKTHLLKLGVNVTVNDHGVKSSKKSLRLR